MIYWLECTLPTLAANLALDEALLLEAEAGGPEVLRIWEWPTPAVVLGAGSRLSEEVDEAACLAAGVLIRRRSSGGGSVLLGPGCLLFSLVLSYDRLPLLREVNASYRFILERLCLALELPTVRCAGVSDLAWAGRKVSGNSQQRKRRFLLHHGTLLYGFDLAAVSRFLPVPRRQPDYRQGRSHDDFLANLPVPVEQLRQRLRRVWEAVAELLEWPQQRVEDLVREKYDQPEWVRRR
ncbi:MAG: lipoate--protein ligase family protein [Gemmataceae bacterium]|nr:lipoate--protein ligase family protein [Gemmataceae bacterium]MDW8265278.1 lipoate--protein ligase family protein [Gemmataceae bacterium]